ncbi:hypothetical protein SAMN05216218_1317 [Halorientalis regularis]|uniref:Uncharacterized protein n=1 Tax=Halorientalis regularis TaxID=660518 RepID=A0A1G7TVQ6_9EURY|nr:hypothetical protein SAMN05216218_1317 [Halorientalis regularis]
MAADEPTGSGDTTQRLTRATQLATILSATVATATSITTIATTSFDQLILFVSLMIVLGVGLYLFAANARK